jgi:hypothetical protein
VFLWMRLVVTASEHWDIHQSQALRIHAGMGIFCGRVRLVSPPGSVADLMYLSMYVCMCVCVYGGMYVGTSEHRNLRGRDLGRPPNIEAPASLDIVGSLRIACLPFKC